METKFMKMPVMLEHYRANRMRTKQERIEEEKKG